MITFYGYPACSTCRSAKAWLVDNGKVIKELDITQNPPTKALLKSILASGEYSLKDLFNKSGELYRQMNMKEQVDVRAEADLLELLAQHGKLVKRPIVTNGMKHTVGFKEEVFDKVWK